MGTDLIDRQYVSRFSQPTFGITVYKAGVPDHADAPPVVSYLHNDPAVVEWTRNADEGTPGSYSVTLSSVETSAPEVATLQWEYQISGVSQIYGLDIQVGPNSPDYDALPPAWRLIVEAAWVKFSDLFDSPFGGPNLAVYVQTHFGRNRLAQLLPSALQRLNSASSPYQTYPLGGVDFPMADYSGLLAQSLYIEILKHLIRSYVEQPEAVLGTVISRLDRRDYMDRWKTILDMEMAEFTLDLQRYRRSFMNLGAVSVLVAGGAYAQVGPELNPGGAGEAAARGYFYVSRWH